MSGVKSPFLEMASSALPAAVTLRSSSIRPMSLRPEVFCLASLSGLGASPFTKPSAFR